MKLNRRNVFALGGLGAIGAGTGAFGAEYAGLSGGLTIRICHDGKGWCVAVPDWEAIDRVSHVPATKLMPMAEFLAELDKMEEA